MRAIVRSPILLPATAFLLLVGAASPEGEPRIPSGYTVVPVREPGTLRGRVVLAGSPPRIIPLVVRSDPGSCGEGEKPNESLILGKDQGIRDCLVFLDHVHEGKAPGPRPRPGLVLDQVRCTFVPHIQVALLGEDILVKNSDPTFHNVHAVRKRGGVDEFNLALPQGLPGISHALKTAGHLVVRCDAGHVWMRAHIHVVANPYYSLTGADGSFEIGGIPPGRHTLRISHEMFEELRTEVEVPRSGVAHVDVRGELEPQGRFRMVKEKEASPVPSIGPEPGPKGP